VNAIQFDHIKADRAATKSDATRIADSRATLNHNISSNIH